MVGLCAVALVMMIDSSSSVNTARFRMQRDATAAALENSAVTRIIEKQGGIAVSVVGFSYKAGTLLDWTVLHNAEDAAHFADLLRKVSHSYGSATLTGHGLEFSLEQLRHAPCGENQVIDVSTDGPGDDDAVLGRARREAETQGVHINGLLVTPDYPAMISDDYRKREIENGMQWMNNHLITENGFAVIANGAADYPDIIRRKIAAEIALLSVSPEH